jgi:hypothetical protein
MEAKEHTTSSSKTHTKQSSMNLEKICSLLMVHWCKLKKKTLKCSNKVQLFVIFRVQKFKANQTMPKSWRDLRSWARPPIIISLYLWDKSFQDLCDRPKRLPDSLNILYKLIEAKNLQLLRPTDRRHQKFYKQSPPIRLLERRWLPDKICLADVRSPWCWDNQDLKRLT